MKTPICNSTLCRLLLLLTLVSACGDDDPVPMDSGVDTALDAEFDTSPDVGEDTAVDSGTDTSVVDSGSDAATDVGEDTGGFAGLVDLPPPAPPAPSDVVETISIAVQTADAPFAGTDSGQELCFGGDRCFPLNVEDVDDFRDGGIDVYHFEGVRIPRDELTEVTLQTRSDPATDNDRWQPACLEIRFDGEPVYCNGEFTAFIGTGDSSGETRSFTDPRGFHETCNTCQGDLLTHGPMLGSPEPTAARVWGRADASRVVGLRMSENPDLSDSAMVAWAIPEPEDDFTFELTVDALPSDRTFFYRVEVDGDEGSPIRALTTAPAASAETPFRFAFGSCSRDDEQPIFSAVSAARPDLFLFVGDNHYGNSLHLAAHRFQYRRNRAMPERAEMIANTPTIATWDDHDFVANNSNGTCLGIDNARRAFGEYWANADAGEDGSGVYFHQRFGAADFFVLDCRTFRPEVGDVGNRCEPDPAAPFLPVEDGPLGSRQTAWLLDGLSGSDAAFKFIACGSRFNPEGSVDSWARYDAARNALFNEIADREIEGVVLLSGDIHRSLLSSIDRPRGYNLPELVSSPLAIAPGTCRSEEGLRDCLGERSFLTVDVEPDRADPRLIVRVVDIDGAERAAWTINASDLR